MKKPVEICILAAGLGTRMKSSRPKALQSLAGRPVLTHLLETAATLEPDQVHVVVGQGADEVRAAFADTNVNFVMQAERRGTGHAVKQVVPHLKPDSRLVILLGDAPLVEAATLARMIAEPCELGVLTVELPNPFNYGRIIRGEGDTILQIVEERDTTTEQQAIREINTGVMVTETSLLPGWLDQLTTDNEQGEYLLTDIVAIAGREGRTVKAVLTEDQDEARGFNNMAQLAILEKAHRRRAALRLMEQGVHLVDPERTDIRGQVSAGQDVLIDINVVVEGDCTLADDVTIGPNCVLKNCRIGARTEIRANTIIEGAEIASDCIVGPFARLRPGSQLEQDAAIGNFVEVKNSVVGKGSKASHLAYLGDATLGRDVNIGAGTITCNYDGASKHPTEIGDDVFVGSNSSLVAPVVIEAGATIGAGSTISRKVGAGELAIARGKQKSVPGWKRPRKD